MSAANPAQPATLPPPREIAVRVAGAELAGTLFTPNTKEPSEILVLRTPYDRWAHHAEAKAWARRGIAMFVQDVRGRYGSSGTWQPYQHEQHDGLATLDTLSRLFPQARFALVGGSYAAGCARAAAEHPRVCAALSAVPAIGLNHTILGRERLPHLHRHAWWWSTHGVGRRSRLTSFTDALATHPDLFTEPDPIVIEDALDAPGFAAALRHAWNRADWPAFPSSLPRLELGGWWDPFVDLSWDVGTAPSRPDHGVTIGPWAHDLDGRATIGEDSPHPAAAVPIGPLQHRWLRSIFDEQPLPLDAVWVGDGWLPSTTAVEPLHLRATATGRLLPDSGAAPPVSTPKPELASASNAAPHAAKAPEADLLPWDHLPEHGLPGCCWPIDVRGDAAHPDCRRFIAEPCTTPLRILGRIRVRVRVHSIDTHSGPVVARLSVRRRNGAVIPITQAVHPGTNGAGLHELDLEARATGVCLSRGESLVLDLSGGAAPFHPPSTRPARRALDPIGTFVIVPQVKAEPAAHHPWKESLNRDNM